MSISNFSLEPYVISIPVISLQANVQCSHLKSGFKAIMWFTRSMRKTSSIKSPGIDKETGRKEIRNAHNYG